jgi:alpha-L-fucosidase
VPARLRNAETTANLSQQADNAAFRERPISSQDVDLGSRAYLKEELELGGELCWYPAEVDVSIRPGWFYHKKEDDKVRPVANLLDIYEKSVGGNAVLLLNIPPDTRGRINEKDVAVLKELGDRIRGIYSDNLFEDAKASCGQTVLIDDDTYWSGEQELTINLPDQKTLTHIVLCEQTKESQRIEAFSIANETGEIFKGTIVGAKKICRFNAINAKTLRIIIEESRGTPNLRFVAGYFDKDA